MSPSDLNTGTPDRFSLPNEMGSESGDVDDQVVAGNITKNPADSFQTGSDLVDPILDRNIERLQAASPYLSVRIETMPVLESFDSFFKPCIKNICLECFRAEKISCQPKSVAELRNSGSSIPLL